MNQEIKYQNRQLYCECQLVSLWNAKRFLENIPEMGSKQYKKICEESYCVAGSCLNKNKEIERLNLKAIKGKMTLEWIKNHLPVQFSVFCHRGYHCVLAIAVKKEKILLTNYTKGKLHWMSWKKLKEIHNRHLRPIQWKVRYKKGT